MHFWWIKGRCVPRNATGAVCKELNSHCCFAVFLGLPLHCWFLEEQWLALILALPIPMSLADVKLEGKRRWGWSGFPEAPF